MVASPVFAPDQGNSCSISRKLNLESKCQSWKACSIILKDLTRIRGGRKFCIDVPSFLPITILRFQEQVLSFRTIVFTEQRVFFRCYRNVWGEDIIYDNFPLVENKAVASRNEIPKLFFDDGDKAMSVLY